MNLSRIDFSHCFTINTTIDPSKGELIGIYNPYIEWFNATAFTNYIFTYEFSVEQIYVFRINEGQGPSLLEEGLNKTSSTIEYTSKKSERLMIMITTYGFKYTYVNFPYEEVSMIPSYPTPLVNFISFFGVIIILSKRKRRKTVK